MEKNSVKVRIAPSPTGDPHVGTAYIALFNYAFAKQNNGKFVLRIEDTDQTRSSLNSEKKIFEALRWLGLQWDEGPDVGGAHGPYRQSERLAIYQEHIETLLQNKTAYKCFCSPARLESVRAEQMKNKQTPQYDRFCLHLSEEEVATRIQNGEKYTVRLKVPENVSFTVQDLLRKPVVFESKQVDDQVLMKSDGFPTYHFANVVDDHLMGITHVIRAEEWLSSTPKHILLYRAFGWQEPVWIHMPLLRNQDKSKISKRKNPTSLNFYRRIGVLPEAMLNYLGLMGWSISGDRDLFTLEEFVSKISFERISLGGPIFDLKKLLWINEQYIRKESSDQLLGRLKSEILSDDFLLSIIDAYKNRVSSMLNFLEEAAVFFTAKFELTEHSFASCQHAPNEIAATLEVLIEKIEANKEYSKSKIEEAVATTLKQVNWPPPALYSVLRIAIMGQPRSTDIQQTITLLGKELTIYRLQKAIEYLRTLPKKS